MIFSLLLFITFFLFFTLHQWRNNTNGFTIQIPIVQMLVGWEHETGLQGQSSLKLWSAKCQGLHQRQFRTENKGHTPSRKIETKILAPPGLEPWQPGWKSGTLLTIPKRRTLSNQLRQIRGLFFFKVRSVAKLKPQWESDEALRRLLRSVSSMPADRDTSQLSVLST